MKRCLNIAGFLALCLLAGFSLGRAGLLGTPAAAQPPAAEAKPGTVPARTGVTITTDSFKRGRLQKVMLTAGASAKAKSKTLVVVTGPAGSTEIRIRCGCDGRGGCKIHVEPPWIYCAPTVCSICEMSIGGGSRY